MRESVVEKHLCDMVKRFGGETRKVRWIGRRAAPDRLVMLRGRHPLVETKRPGEEARAEQDREHAKLRAAGFEVYVLDTKEAVDAFIGVILREK